LFNEKTAEKNFVYLLTSTAENDNKAGNKIFWRIIIYMNAVSTTNNFYFYYFYGTRDI